jgi:hypothetical protein
MSLIFFCVYGASSPHTTQTAVHFSTFVAQGRIFSISGKELQLADISIDDTTTDTPLR